MKKETMMAHPIGMFASLVVTIFYKPDYDKGADISATWTPDPETVTVPSIYVEQFIREAEEYLNLEVVEDWEDAPMLTQFITQHKDFCPFIANAMYVDEGGRVKVVDMDATSPFPSAFDRMR